RPSYVLYRFPARGLVRLLGAGNCWALRVLFRQRSYRNHFMLRRQTALPMLIRVMPAVVFRWMSYVSHKLSLCKESSLCRLVRLIHARGIGFGPSTGVSHEVQPFRLCQGRSCRLGAGG